MLFGINSGATLGSFSKRLEKTTFEGVFFTASML